MLHAVVHSAGLQDRDGGVLVMATLFGMFPFLRKLYADAGYRRPKFQAALKRVLRQVQIRIVRRSDTAQGFEVLRWRWIVERTFAWTARCRRLAKDWENLGSTALAFLRLASIRLMMRRFCQP
jgi:transposase